MVDKFSNLPEELLNVEEEIAKEQQKIKIKMEKRKFGREVTLIEGIDEKSVDMKELLKTLKKSLGCGGTFKDGVIELQGDHRYRVKEILIKEGFLADNIEIE
ncbi:MAG TPA: stress response translation initiation inhibitor YciH [Nautiliaceae bacterium]|nr:stress response translation initiation inhibitor YciH [Nautiliaceae bacterium]